MNQPGDRIPVPDQALMRRAGVRMAIALVVVLALTSVLTIAGISLVVAGELPGLPLAVGGAALAVAALVVAAAVGRVRRSAVGGSISAAALLSARRTIVMVRRGAYAAVAVLLLYGLARTAVGDVWSLITAGMISIALWTVAAGAKRMRIAYDARLKVGISRDYRD